MHRCTEASAFYSCRNIFSQIFLAIDVNDQTVLRKEQDLRKLRGNLDRLFELKVLENAQYLFSIEITHSKKGDMLLGQERFVNKVLQVHRMEFCAPRYTPLDIRAVIALTARLGEKVLGDREITTYQNLVRSMLYASIVMGQDIAHVAAFLGRFRTRPMVVHLTKVKYVLHYLQHMKMLKLHLSENVQPKVELGIYADADFADDISDQKSTSSIAIFVFASLVYSKTKKQSLVVQSTADTEFVASAYAMLEAEWIKRILEGLGNNATKVIL